MSNIIPLQDFGLLDRHGVPVVSSRAVAQKFGKEHKNVLQAIENLECSGEFRRLNFQPSSYRNEQNKKQPEVLVTRDGFTFLAMGFTGKKAAQWKEQYIAAFNQMESLYCGTLKLLKTHSPILGSQNQNSRGSIFSFISSGGTSSAKLCPDGSTNTFCSPVYNRLRQPPKRFSLLRRHQLQIIHDSIHDWIVHAVNRWVERFSGDGDK
jgi:Rha family phage regulatory protein